MGVKITELPSTSSPGGIIPVIQDSGTGLQTYQETREDFMLGYLSMTLSSDTWVAPELETYLSQEGYMKSAGDVVTISGASYTEASYNLVAYLDEAQKYIKEANISDYAGDILSAIADLSSASSTIYNLISGYLV